MANAYTPPMQALIDAPAQFLSRKAKATGRGNAELAADFEKIAALLAVFERAAAGAAGFIQSCFDQSGARGTAAASWRCDRRARAIPRNADRLWPAIRD